MRKFVLVLLLSGPLHAQTPEIQFAVGCTDKGEIVVLYHAIAATKGAFKLPRSMCDAEV